MSELIPNAETTGGGLAVIAEVTVAGGAVQTLTSGTIALTEGKRYNFEGQIKSVGTSPVRAFINGLTTLADYRHGEMSSANVHLDSSTSPSGSTSAGGSIFFTGSIRVFNSKVFLSYRILSEKATSRNLSAGMWHSTATDCTELQFTSDAAGGIDDDSSLLIWEAY